jgi:two-component system chemotaxis sensor kinase CheA
LEDSAETRVSRGKNPAGKVSLSFQNDGNYLVVEVRDDGKGIDPRVIEAKAREKGLVSSGATLTDKELIYLIFHPGFSTKTATTEVSGRGVGMDVVKTNVEKVGGFVDVTSKVGEGSVFRMQIPLSLAVIDGLIVMGSQGRFVVPLAQVQETINLATQTVHRDQPGIGACFELRGQVVPLISLEESLQQRVLSGAAGESSQSIALIVNVQGRPLALTVADILRSQQIVVKPLDNGLSERKGWIGTCILGDGIPTLILSPKDLLLDRVQFKNEHLREVA